MRREKRDVKKENEGGVQLRISVEKKALDNLNNLYKLNKQS